MRNKIVFYLNGKRREEGPEKASMMLAEYLRYDQALTGTKIVCAEGDCGACSVLRYFPHIKQGIDTDNYLPINSCITLVAQLDGSSLVTVDALKKNNELHESQRAMVECHGSQCGFCTPGFVVALTGLVEEKIAKQEKNLSAQDAKNCMTGNLCRCTGYQPIINAALSIDIEKCESIKERFFTEHQHLELKKAFLQSVALESPEFSFFAPKTMKDALDFLKANPETKIVASGTDLGVVHNKRKIQLTKLLSLHLVEDLYEIKKSGNEISLGARVTITEFRHFIKAMVPEFATYIDVFASPQIKNIATIVGNIANASPIGDTPPAFLALNANVEVASLNGEREIPLNQFFLAYRTINIHPGEIITRLKFDLPRKQSILRFIKVSNRKDLDISAVNLAINLEWKDQAKKQIGEIIIAAGGVAATPLRFLRTEEFLKKNPLTIANLDLAIKELHSEFNPISDVRASSSYRHVVIENHFRRFLCEVGGLE
ncbi:MAG TPA: FAD binding domain-containing protein [Bacteriovoracaceae bacterium]|nr:FAD binding domain-containing protein [Bacteriovoracaceae bacterium]